MRLQGALLVALPSCPNGGGDKTTRGSSFAFLAAAAIALTLSPISFFTIIGASALKLPTLKIKKAGTAMPALPTGIR